MHTKRIAAGYGKKPKWVVTPKGPHRKGEGIPLMIILRDMLEYADNAHEAKRIISRGLVLVDKKQVKDPRYAVGLMDVVEIPKTGEYFRILPGKKRYDLRPIDEKEAEIKPCKIIDKAIVRGKHIQLNLHDGNNILVDDDKYKTKDTVILKLPSHEIKDHITFDKGCAGLIMRGRHSGGTGKVGEVSTGNAVQKSLTEIGDVHTLTDYIFIIGKSKPMIAT